MHLIQNTYDNWVYIQNTLMKNQIMNIDGKCVGTIHTCNRILILIFYTY